MMKSKTVYQLCKMDYLLVRRYDIDYKDKNDLESKIDDIEMIWEEKYLSDTFQYMPMEVHMMQWMNIDISQVYEDDIEDDNKLLHNIKEFVSWE